MSITSFKHSVCLSCSTNVFTIISDTAGTVSSPITDESVTVTLPDDSSYTIDLSANGDSLFGNSMTVTPINCTAASVGFTPASGVDYVVHIIYTDSNGVIQTADYSYPSASLSFSTIGNGIAGLINAGSSTTGVSATYNSVTRNVDIVGSSFGVCVVSNATTSLTVSLVSAELIGDGINLVNWTLTDGDGTNSYGIQSMFLCNVSCCVREKMSSIDLDCGCSGSKKADASIDAMLMLEGIQYSMSCGKTSKALKILEDLEKICNNECKSC